MSRVACGDCCTPDDACYFYSAYADGSAVTGAKYEDTVSIGGFSTTAVVGVYTWVHDEFEVSPEVDGILGLSFASGARGLCNPACSETVWDRCLFLRVIFECFVVHFLTFPLRV